MKGDGEPDFLMSLIDTLTCGLGASILLFVIFVLLATVQEPVASGAAARPVDARWRSAAGAGVPDMLWLRLRADCGFIRSVGAEEKHGFDEVRFVDRRGAEEPEHRTCVALFSHSDPPPVAYFRASRLPTDGLRITAIHGGRQLTPDGGARWEFHAWAGGSGTLPIFTLRPNDPKNPVAPSSSWVRLPP